MTGLADFLRARYAERRAIAEAAACKACSGDWRYKRGGDRVYAVETFPESPPAQRELWTPLVTEAGSYTGDVLDDEIGEYVAVNDPADVLADLDAKLAIVDLMDQTLRFAEGDSEVDHYGALGNAEEVLSLLARPFAGHPDYKEDWRP